MRVKIIKVFNNDHKNNVIFSTEFGDAQAIWNGELPEVGKEYFVEIEIQQLLLWEKDILVSEKQENILGMENNVFYMIGLLESIEDDGYTVIRLGEDVLSLETSGNPIQHGVFVKVKTNNIVLYNINY